MRAFLRARTGLALLAIAVLTVAVIAAGTAIAGTYVPGRAGVLNYNAPVCGRGYVPVNLGRGDYYNVYNAQDGSTCISAQRHHLSWYVTSKSPSAHGWQFPNISSGIAWGRYTCYDGRSAYRGHGSQCMRYPVQQYRDGMPVTGVQYWPHLANGNVAYDIWFNRTYVAPSLLRQNNGAEIMIWLDYPGLQGMVRAHTVRTVRIGGYRWNVMAWYNTWTHPGTPWEYVAYVAVHPMLSVPRLWLNEFFREAEAHGELDRTWWLTNIAFGTEINQGGQGFAVRSYYLTGVPTT